MLPVLKHALEMAEEFDGVRYGSLLLLDPTSPGRTTQDVEEAVRVMESDSNCDGVIGVSMPDFNPLWHSVIEDDRGYMADLIPGADRYSRRQDVPNVWRINACLYLWRRDFLMKTENWRHGRMRMLDIPESRAIHIDDLDGFAAAEEALRAGRIRFEWLEDDGA
jgi:CMP-N-acetylneuraminic acid synthetase